MTIFKGFLVLLLSAIAFAVGGALIGFTLGVTAPGYYRAVFRTGTEPWFDPVAVGVGLGLTQGVICGVVVGCVIVVAVSLYNSRRQALEQEFHRRWLASTMDQPLQGEGITTMPQ